MKRSLDVLNNIIYSLNMWSLTLAQVDGIAKKIDSMDKYSARVEDWREIARALDRLFLLSYISVQILG